MNVLIAPDKFKGSLSAAAAAQAIGRGVRAVFCDAKLDLAPIADGGEGFAEALWLALRGRWIEAVVKDPLGRDVAASYAWVDDRKLAVIEMSEASGLRRLSPGELAPLTASTFGTGQLIRDATERGAATILVGLGGSATTDGGIGMAEALGYRFLTSDGDVIAALPANLLALTRIDRREAIELPEIIAACDVQNPLLGTRGTAHVFAPQKGADAKGVEVLELCLENLAQIAAEEFGFDHRTAAGAGAAGGLGFGLMTFCNAQIRSGFEVVAEALHLEQRIAASDMVITGEGRVDAQTAEGKGPAGVADLARKHQKPVLAFAGAIADREILEPLFAVTLGIVDEVMTIEDAMKRGGELLERAATRAARLLQLGGAL